MMLDWLLSVAALLVALTLGARALGPSIAVGATTGRPYVAEGNSLAFGAGAAAPSDGNALIALPEFEVEVQDDAGDPISGYTGTITISKASGTGALSGTLSVACVNGVAAFADVVCDGHNASGGLVLRATADDGDAGDSVDASGIETYAPWSEDASASLWAPDSVDYDSGSGTSLRDRSGNGRTLPFGSGGAAPAWASLGDGYVVQFASGDSLVLTDALLSINADEAVTFALAARVNHLGDWNCTIDLDNGGNSLGPFMGFEYYGSTDARLTGRYRASNGAGRFVEATSASLNRNAWSSYGATKGAADATAAWSLYKMGSSQTTTVVQDTAPADTATGGFFFAPGSNPGPSYGGAMFLALVELDSDAMARVHDWMAAWHSAENSVTLA